MCHTFLFDSDSENFNQFPSKLEGWQAKGLTGLLTLFSIHSQLSTIKGGVVESCADGTIVAATLAVARYT